MRDEELGWTFDGPTLAAELGLNSVNIFNDFVAVAEIGHNPGVALIFGLLPTRARTNSFETWPRPPIRPVHHVPSLKLVSWNCWAS